MIEITEDGEQCQGCFRFGYDPHQDWCLFCGWHLHDDDDDYSWREDDDYE